MLAIAIAPPVAPASIVMYFVLSNFLVPKAERRGFTLGRHGEGFDCSVFSAEQLKCYNLSLA